MTLDRATAATSAVAVDDATRKQRKADVAHALLLFHEPDDIIEIRTPDADGVEGKIVAGYLDGDRVAHHAGEIVMKGKDSPATYATIQRLDPACLDRSPCRFVEVSRYKGQTRPKLTSDADVTARPFLFIDIDPVKAEGHVKDSATDAEKGATEGVAISVKSFMRQHHWPDPVTVDSGNGIHLYYRFPTCITRADSADLDTPAVTRLLKLLGHRFDTPGATIDPTVGNPSRVAKVPGTMARKGKHTADRPHRQCRVVDEPAGWRSPAAAGAIGLGSLVALTLALDPDGSISSDLIVKDSSKAPVAVAGASQSPPDGMPPLAKRVSRAVKYIARMPAGIQGSDGSGATYAAATALVHGFCLDEHSAMDVMRDFNARCVPPWSEGELRHKVADALSKPHDRERGWLLADKPGKATVAVPARRAAPPAPPQDVSATPPRWCECCPRGARPRRRPERVDRRPRQAGPRGEQRLRLAGRGQADFAVRQFPPMGRHATLPDARRGVPPHRPTRRPA